MAKLFAKAEIQKHNSEKDCWVVIYDKVYDVTKFLSQHPGGQEIVLENAGEDATQGFEEIGHSDDARKQLTEFLIGEVDPSDISQNKKPVKKLQVKPTETKIKNNTNTILIVVGLLIAAVSYILLADQ